MSHSKNSPKLRNDNDENVGFAAIGSHGRWEVAIDETTSGDTRWYAQIESPSVYLYFEVPSPHIVADMLAFLREPATDRRTSPGSSGKPCDELMIGKSKDEPVTLVRDDEYSDRYFVVVKTGTRHIVRVTVAGSDLTSVMCALQQVRDDLEND